MKQVLGYLDIWRTYLVGSWGSYEAMLASIDRHYQIVAVHDADQTTVIVRLERR